MIYTFWMPYLSGRYYQWIDILKEKGIHFTDYSISPKYIKNEKYNIPELLNHTDYTFEYLLSKLNKSLSGCTLVIDSDYLVDGFDYNESIIKTRILKILELVNVKIVLIHKDPGLNDLDNLKNVIVVSPTQFENKSNDINYYLIHTGSHKKRNLFAEFFDTFGGVVRHKRFLSTTGFPKPVRILLYFLLKDCGILKDTLYSNLFYHNNQDLSYNNMMISYFGDDIKRIISVAEYEECLKDFPIILDTIWGKTEPFSELPPLHLSMNSYFEIVNATHFESTKELYTSEKIFRPFYSFTIPIYCGSPFLVKYLKNLGFDLFEDIVDTSYDEYTDPLERTLRIFKSISEINDMDLESMHEFYLNNKNRLVSNFNKLSELSETQKSKFIKLL